MCVLLPINHMPCTHTVSVLHTCVDAPHSGIEGHTPCSNIQQHDRPILLSKSCPDCGEDRFPARKGGIAGPVNRSRPLTPFDDTDDSGYQSGFNNEEEEESDLDDVSLPSPSNAEPQSHTTQTNSLNTHTRTSSHSPQLNSRLGLKLKLKSGLTFVKVSTTNRLRRDSIDSMDSNFNDPMPYTLGQQQIPVESEVEISSFVKSRRPSNQGPATARSHVVKRKQSTLLHPSSPPMAQTTFHTATSFSFPEPAKTRNTSTSRRPSDATDRQISVVTRPRKDSTLLHPSRPTIPLAILAEHKIIISVPPKQKIVNDESISSMIQSFPPPPSTFQGPTQNMSAPIHDNAYSNILLPRQRQPSILHSSLSDTEDEGFDEPLDSNIAYVRIIRNDYLRSKDAESSKQNEYDEREGAPLTNTARVVRAIRRHVRPA